jgi:hypothetical protein
MAQARTRTQQGQSDYDAKYDAQKARDTASLPEQSVLAAVPRRLFRFIGWLVLWEEEAGALQRTVVAAVDPV